MLGEKKRAVDDLLIPSLRFFCVQSWKVCLCLWTSICVCFPSKLREEIDKYSIKIYQYPDNESDEDEELKRQDKELKVCHVAV